MSRPFIFISDLKKGNQVWKISIRVVDLWIVKERSGQQHVELVIQDVKGDQIHVLTLHQDFEYWMNNIEEHQTYIVYNGEPLDNDFSFKVCENMLKLLFNGGTTVSKADFPNIPPHEFKFKAISEILDGKFMFDYLYDVIGVLHEVVKSQPANGGTMAYANITLSDESGNIIDVALWEDYGTKLMTYMSSNGIKEPTIVIITHALCKQNSTTGKPSMSNAWSGSRLHINLDHPQVVQFKSKLGITQSSQTALQSFSQTSDSQQPSQDNSFTKMKEVKTIAEINGLQHESFCITVGKTKRFKPTKFGWYYEACPTCNRPNKTPGMPFECTCGQKGVVPVTKYKIEIEVEYDNHVGFFMFLDKECIPIVGMYAQELRKVMKDAGEDNHKIYPSHLDQLLEKEFAFRIKFQPYFGQSSIVTLTEDVEVIKMIKDYMHPNEQNVSIQQNWSPETSSNKTPTKKMIISNGLEEISSSEIITPKESAKKIKKE